MTEKVYENECVVCELDDLVPVLRHRWIRRPSSEEFRSGLISILEEYKKYKHDYDGLKWLADTELLGQLTKEDEEWLTSEWDHLLFNEAGVKVHAVILGPDLFADYPMEIFKRSSNKKFDEKGVKLEVFANEEKAYGWLNEN